MRFFKLFLITVLAGFLASSAWADVSIEISVSASRVTLGNQVALDIIVSNADGKIQKPVFTAIDGFTSYSQGHSQEFSMVNGITSSRSVFSYVLVPNSIGKKTIGPFEVKIGEKIFKVAPVQVEVIPGGASSTQTMVSSQGPVTAPPSRALPNQDVSDKDIFVQTWLDKDEVYVNEPAMLTFTLYTRLPATYKGFEKEPVTTGFWVEDFPPEKTVKRTEKILNGVRYVVADVRKMALFPTQAGIFTVDPGTMSANVEIRDNDPFDNFYSSNVFGRQTMRSPFMSQVISKILPTQPITVTVKALPEEGKPAGFSGAVGSYLMEGSIDKNEVQAGDPVTYRIRVWGQGNLGTLQMPVFPKLEDFKVYDASSSSNISKDRLIVEGEKVAETVIVPKKAGKFILPPVVFSYFDLKEKTYRVMKTDPQTVTVTGSAEPEESGAGASGGAGIEPVSKEDVSVLAKDIRYVKAADKSSPISGRFFYKQTPFWALVGFLGALWALFSWLTGLKASVKDTKGFRFRRSHTIAKSKLRAASKMLKEDKQSEFYAEISRVVYGYFADKLDLQVQAVSLLAIEQRTHGEMTAEFGNQIKKLFDELSLARFGSARKTHEEMKEVFNLADKVITSFERIKLK